MNDIEINDDAFESFSEIIQHLDLLAKEQHLHIFSKLSTFIDLVQEPLSYKENLPNEFTLIKKITERRKQLIKARLLLYDGKEIIGLREIIPTYNEAIKLFKNSEKTEIITKKLNDYLKLYIIYKLWNPGLITSKELSSFSGKEPNDLSNIFTSLINANIIERKTRGIYVRGNNGKLAMNIFAALILLWRKTDDIYRSLHVDRIARIVRFRLSERGAIIDTIDDQIVPEIEVLPTEPIIVDAYSGNTIDYCTRTIYSHRYGKAMDSIFDNKPQLVRYYTPSSFIYKKGPIVRNSMKVTTAFDKAIDEGTMLFLRKSEELFYIPPPENFLCM